jgi:2-dehydropantoate 2-reductase
MKIVIIGPGALGCLFAASIGLQTGSMPPGSPADEIWLLDHDPDRARFLAKQGLILERDGELFSYPVQATNEPAAIGEADLVFLCVKSYKVAEALARSTACITDGTLLIPLQNGIAHLQILKEMRPTGLTASGVTAQGATLLSPGRIRHAGRGPTKIGMDGIPTSTEADRLVAAAALLNRAGIATEIVPDIIDHIWAKLFINVGINALSAIYNCPNGELLNLPTARQQLAGAVAEAAAVARAREIHINDDPLQATLDVCRATAANISSMLQDVRRRRPTEIDAINGAVVILGRQHHLPVEVNEQLVQKIKEIERHYLF